MAKPPKSETYSEQEALERMNKALKKTLERPPETHKDMVKRRRNPQGAHAQSGKAKGKT